jgi:hypothetical protein
VVSVVRSFEVLVVERPKEVDMLYSMEMLGRSRRCSSELAEEKSDSALRSLLSSQNNHPRELLKDLGLKREKNGERSNL